MLFLRSSSTMLRTGSNSISNVCRRTPTSTTSTSTRKMMMSIQNNKQYQQQQRRCLHFASKEYDSCFHPSPNFLPIPNIPFLRASALQYMENFNPQLWHEQPIVSLLKGKELCDIDGTIIDTVDAMGNVNGKQMYATREQIETIKHHIKTYQSPYTDLRTPVRDVEQKLLNDHVGFLIGNQCFDFYKQDGVTEIEESIVANDIERQLNDLLLDKYERDDIVTIHRKPIYVSTVSNFSNFLDLFRKTIRSLEIGIPVIVLCRSNTSQHSYRWTKLLMDLLITEQQVDPGMITFLSCSLDDIISVTTACYANTGNLYTTCSRQLAINMNQTYPKKVVASTGGPNTLIYTSSTDKHVAATAAATTLPTTICDAIRISAAIECSGQCTALRHAVVPSTTTDDEIQHIFDRKNVQEIDTATTALQRGIFAGIFPNHGGTKPPSTSPGGGYQKSTTVDAYYKIHNGTTNTNNIIDEQGSMKEEYWRKVVVDFTKLDINASSESDGINQLAIWLRQNQPISMAVNGPRRDALAAGIQLWEQTSLVVNTIGSTDDVDSQMPAALSCQARPQDGEIFGEFPPRSSMEQYTKYPVIVPSSNPSYDTYYTLSYLKKKSQQPEHQALPLSYHDDIQKLLRTVTNDTIRGYCNVLLDYLSDVCQENPKQGIGTVRTSLYGLQRPPLGTKSILHCSSGTTTFDDIAPILLLFIATNAREQIVLSIDPAGSTNTDQLIALCSQYQIPYVLETASELQHRKDDTSIFHIIQLDESELMSKKMKQFPLAGHFVSLYLPLGHIKTTMSNDQEFIEQVKQSKKWLTMI